MHTPTPNEERIEQLLSNIQPLPGGTFHWKMQDAPWQPARNPKGTPRMKFKLAFSALAMLLVLTATVAFVPPVRAQVEQWYTLTFDTPDGTTFGVSGPQQPMNFPVFQPGYLPKGFGDTTVAAFGENVKILFKTGDQFMVLTESEAAPGESLPDGEPVRVNGRAAALNRGLFGRYDEPLQGLKPSAQGSVSIVENASGTETGTAPAIVPLTFNYTDAIQLTFILDGTHIEILTNLPLEELMKIAEGLIPAQQ